jgi:hypothetical protein
MCYPTCYTMQKAIVFVLVDLSSSTNKLYPSSSLPTTTNEQVPSNPAIIPPPTTSITTTTRLDSAKHVMQLMISDLMLQSMTNEVCVVGCKTKHHKMAFTTDGTNDNNDDTEINIPFHN